MAIRKFLTSVADVYGYDENDNILFTSKTLLDSSIEVSLGSAPVRGGQGNQLQYIYYHTGEFKVNLTDTQWNLALLGASVGADAETGSYYQQETVAMTSATASVSDTPLAFEGTTVYGWATNPSGETQKVTFSTKSFTVSGSVAGNWCVRYYTANLTSGNSITVEGNMIPKVMKLVMEAQLNSSDVSTNKIGIVQIIIPRLALSGAFTISMKADGVSNTPLSGNALVYIPSGTSDDPCESANGYYAKIIEVIDDTNWYDNLIDISISGGDFPLTVGERKTLVVYGITDAGNSFILPSTTNLTFGSSASGIATIGATSGSVLGVASGSATLTATLGTVVSPSLVDTCIVTVTS